MKTKLPCLIAASLTLLLSSMTRAQDPDSSSNLARSEISLSTTTSSLHFYRENGEFSIQAQLGLGYSFSVIPALQVSTASSIRYYQYPGETSFTTFDLGAGLTVNAAQSWDDLRKAPYASLLLYWNHYGRGANEMTLIPSVGVRAPITDTFLYSPSLSYAWRFSQTGKPWALSLNFIAFSAMF